MNSTKLTNNLNEKAMLVSLKISAWSGRTKDRQVSSQVLNDKGADSDAGAWWTYLLPKETTKRLNKAANKCRTTLNRYTLPWMDNGLRILPSAMFLTFRKEMATTLSEYETIVAKFVANYPTIKAEAERRLGKLASTKRIPEVWEIQDKFAAKTTILPIPETSDFRIALSDVDISEIRKEMETDLNNMVGKAMENLWYQLIEMIKKIQTTTAKPNKIFRDSMISNLKDFCEMIPKLNITDDPKLEEARKEALKELATLSPTDLRESKTDRKAANKAASDMLDRIGSYNL